MGAEKAAYISFGRALGHMEGHWMDVHGAGAQRSDPKEGDPSEYPIGHGPQGDAIRIYDHARCVRGGALFIEGDGILPEETPDQGKSPPQDYSGFLGALFSAAASFLELKEYKRPELNTGNQIVGLKKAIEVKKE